MIPDTWTRGIGALIAAAIVAVLGMLGPPEDALRAQPKAQAQAQAQGLAPGDYEFALEHRDRIRSYLLHLPPAYDGETPLPLVLALHGGGGNPRSMARKTNFNALADREGFIVVYPAGTGRLRDALLTWNAGHCCGYALRNNVDDVGFLRALIEELQRSLAVDPARVYVTGHSNGAMMAYRLGAELPEQIAAIGPVAGSIGGRASADAPLVGIPPPSRSVSVVAIHGFLDENVNYEGGHGRRTSGTREDLSVAESIAFWVEANRCDPEPRRERIDEAGNVIRETYSGCLDGTEVVLYTLLDGGHAWPGSGRGDRPSPSLSATEALWAFFREHPSPPSPLPSGLAIAEVPEEIPVEVVRDTFGVPHIYAATDEGALYGFGYVQAEDHLLDMLQNYLAAEGRRAEFFGPQYLESDVQTRAVLNYSDEDLLRRVDPETVRLVSAFAQGVNAYIREHQAQLPGWARDFEVTAAQVLRFAHYAMVTRSLNAAAQELRQGAGTAPVAVLEPPDAVEASNQWVVGSSRTQEGAPIFLMDPHLPWSGMNRWYEAHLVGETLGVYGATFYGSPFIAMGHNGNVAWSMTRNGPDLADVFVEELHPDDPMRYRTESGWAAMAVREEVFRIKGGDPITRKIYYTRNGWVVSLEPERNRAIVVALEGLDLVDSLTQFLAMNRARNIEEFKRAVAMHKLLLWNVMAADSEGHLFYVYNARLHRRSERWGRAEWRPGWDPEARWRDEILPFEELPQIEDPESDWMQNNNVMPWFVTSGLGLGMDPQDFPSYLVKHNAGLNDRGRRASDALSQARGWTMTNALALATDTLVVAAEDALPQILGAYQAASPERRRALAPAMEILRGWNRRADIDQPGMTLFYFWWHRPERERERDPLKALEAAISEMEELYGTIEVPWGEIHRIRRGSIDLPIAGEQKPPTLWMASGKLNERGMIYTDHGSSFTMVVKLGPQVEAYSLLPYGTSEDPASPHYADQAPLKSRGELKRAWFSRDEVLAHAERTYTLGFRMAQARGRDPSPSMRLITRSRRALTDT